MSGAQGDGQRFENGLTSLATLLGATASMEAAVQLGLSTCNADSSCGAVFVWLRNKDGLYAVQTMASGGGLRSTTLEALSFTKIVTTTTDSPPVTTTAGTSGGQAYTQGPDGKRFVNALTSAATMIGTFADRESALAACRTACDADALCRAYFVWLRKTDSLYGCQTMAASGGLRDTDLESYSFEKIIDTTAATTTETPATDPPSPGYSLVTGEQGDGQRFSTALTSAATMIGTFSTSAEAITTCLAGCTASTTCNGAFVWLRNADGLFGCQHVVDGGSLRSTST